MEQLLNKTYVRTCNNFKINELKVDLDFKEDKFSELEIESSELDKLDINKSIKSNFLNKVGLFSKKYYSLEVLVKNTLSNSVFISYDFSDSNYYLADEIVLNLKENTSSDFIIIFKGENKCISNCKLVINADNNSDSNISIVNLVNDSSSSFLSVESNLKENALVTHNYIDLGGNLKVSNFYIELNGDNSISDLNSIYMGCNSDRIDMNYYIKCNNLNTKGTILSYGTLNDLSYKSFKGTIDFIKGCSKSVGMEQENCMLLSNKCKSKSLPILLCGEENVVGTHGVSSGKIDENKLFYLMSKGLSEVEAKKMIIMSLFNQVINNIKDEKIKEIIIDDINKRL